MTGEAEVTPAPKSEYKIGETVPLVNHVCFLGMPMGLKGSLTEIENGNPTKAKCFTCFQIIPVNTLLLS